VHAIDCGAVIFGNRFIWVAWAVYFSLYKNDCPVTIASLAFVVKHSPILIAEKTLALHPPPQIFLLLLLLLYLALAFD